MTNMKIRKNNTVTILLAMSIFFSGASSLINEFILSSISTMILGNSIEQFSLTIGLMLFAMGVGGFVQQFIDDKNIINKFIVLELILAIIGAFSPISIYSAFAFMPEHFELIHYFFIFSIGFLIGFEIPFIIRMKELYSPDLKKSLSIIFSGDYLGAFIGTLVWVYVLLKTFPLTESSFIVSGSNLLVAVGTYFYLAEKKSIKNAIYILIVSIALIIGYIENRQWNIALEQKLYSDPVIYSKTTKYQHLTLTHNNKMDEYRLYINGNVQFSSLDENIYHEMLVHPAMEMTHGIVDVLVIGGGDGMAVRELKKYKKRINSITMVDLDPDMVNFAKTDPIMKKLNHNSLFDINATIIGYMGDDIVDYSISTTKNNEKKGIKDSTIAIFNALHIDAEKFFRNINKQQYDLIIIDLPDPSTIELTKLYSKEFYYRISKALSSDGIMVVQATSPYHAKNSYLTIANTIKASGLNILPFHQNVPSFGEWGWFIASHHKPNTKINKFIDNVSYITPEIFEASKVFGKNYFKDMDKYPINTWMNPKLLDIYVNNSWLTY